MRRWLRLSLPIFLLAQIACGPSISDVLKTYGPRFREKRAQFQSIAKTLPNPGGGDEARPCPAMSPAIVFDERGKRFNTEMVMSENLSDPDAAPNFDLRLNGDLLVSLKWTGPKNPLSSSVLGDSGDDMTKSLDSALATRYLVVNRVVSLVEPEARDETLFSAGRLALESFVVDLADNKTLCSFSLSAQTASNVEYLYKAEQSQQNQLQKFARSTLWEDARRKLADELRRRARAEIVITD